MNASRMNPSSGELAPNKVQESFTPGPWRAVFGDIHYHGDSEEDNGGGFTIMMGNYSARGGRVVHSFHYADGVFPFDKKDYDEAEANARLIAAAPDLYAALKAISGATSGFDPMFAEYSGAAFDLARAALSKATGGA